MVLDDMHLKEFRDARAAGYKVSPEEVLAAVNRLPARQRQAFTLHFLEGNNITETAEAMHISRQGVQNLINAGQVKLAAYLSLPHIRQSE